MSEDFDPTLAGYSSEEDDTRKATKRPAATELHSEIRKQAKLPSAKELLQSTDKPDFLASVDLKRPVVRIAKKPVAAVIEKPAVLNAAKIDPIEQYDYFASHSDANLSLWQSPQDLPDPDRPWDKRKMIKKVDTRRVAVLGLEGRGKYEKQEFKRWEVPLPAKKP